MAELTLNQKFQKYTGLNFVNIDTLLENASTEEEQEKVYDFIAWNLKRGTLTDNGKFKELKEEILNAIGRSTVEEITEEDPTKYTAAEAAAYNATLDGAVTTDSWKVKPVEGQEAVEAVEGVHWTQEEIDAAQEGDEAYGKTTEDWKVEPVEGKEAVAAVEGIKYTQEEADAYNATLDGAVKEGDPKPEQQTEP